MSTAVWLSGNAFVLVNEVTLRRARLVLGWVTVCGRVNRLAMYPDPRVNSAWPSLRGNEYQRKLGSKRAHRAIH